MLASFVGTANDLSVVEEKNDPRICPYGSGISLFFRPQQAYSRVLLWSAPSDHFKTSPRLYLTQRGESI